MNSSNIVLAGVGGQGILLAAEILGTAAVKEGYNVQVSELHGMAQRGGAVVSNVRIGEKAIAPTVLEGTADVIVGFEPMEALRSIKFASEKTLIIINSRPFKISGTEYPNVKEILKGINGFTDNVVAVDAVALTEKAGAVVALNIVMVGALAAAEKLPISLKTLKEALRELVPAKHLDMNMRAFELGYAATYPLLHRAK